MPTQCIPDLQLSEEAHCETLHDFSILFCWSYSGLIHFNGRPRLCGIHEQNHWLDPAACVRERERENKW